LKIKGKVSLRKSFQIRKRHLKVGNLVRKFRLLLFHWDEFVRSLQNRFAYKTSSIKKWDKEIKNKTFTTSKVKSIPVEQLKLNLFLKLDAIPELLDVDDVCIENQPSFKNPRMKAIADSLFSWFLIRGKIDKNNKGLKSINKISFMSPSNKLKIDDHKDDIDKEISESSNKYKTTKNLSIEHCKQILNYEPKYIEHLEKYKKKDDLCDVILMSIYYFKNVKKC
jgi:hypothetical protein